MARRGALRGLTATGACVAVLAAAGFAVAGPAAASDDPIAAVQAAAAALPAPYSGWGVTVTPKTNEPGALTVSYNSPALGQHTDNTVYLPDSYQPTGDKSPVLYYLHGTLLPAIENPALDPVTKNESLLNMISAGGGNKQTELFDFSSQRAVAKFLVVSPDTNASHNWCETCMWINGKDDLVPNVPPVTASQVPAEDVLYQEVMPLVEHLFNVQTDRAGRGVIGFSMGGIAALTQGFRHPDKFSYVGSVSGPYDFVTEASIAAIIEGLGYMRDQGYGTQVTNPVEWANFNPKNLIGNFVGSGSTLMLSAGDLCVAPTDAEGAADCKKYPPLTNPLAVWVETSVRLNLDLSVPQIAAAGVEAIQVRHSGIHGANNHRVYAQQIVPEANQAFSTPPATSPTFSYRTADPEFAVWDYQVTDHRDGGPRFLSLEGARHDGTSFSLRGNGTVDLATPATFEPGGDYQVAFSSANGAVREQTVTADTAGRLHITVDLDDSAYRTPNGVTDLLGVSNPGYTTVSISQH